MMKVSDMPTQAEVTTDLLQDPEFRVGWERTTLARAVAIALVKYRTAGRGGSSAPARLIAALPGRSPRPG